MVESSSTAISCTDAVRGKSGPAWGTLFTIAVVVDGREEFSLASAVFELHGRQGRKDGEVLHSAAFSSPPVSFMYRYIAFRAMACYAGYLIRSFPRETDSKHNWSSLVFHGVSGRAHANVEAFADRIIRGLVDIFISCGRGPLQMTFGHDCRRVQDPVFHFESVRAKNREAAGQVRVVTQPNILDL